MLKIGFTTLSILLATTSAFALETAAKQAFLMDHETSVVLFNHHGEEQMVPSSMTKLMTLYLAFEQLKRGTLKLDDTFIVSERAWRMEGSRTFINLGEAVDIETLLDGVIIQSGNDATVALAEGIAGTEEEFVSRMNQKAKTLGLKHSHFVNSTGWPDPGHVMSASDLALLAQAIIRDFPEYYPYFTKKEFTHNNITQQNRNLLINRNIGVDGLKTGHTEDGGYGITTSAKRNGRRIIAVVNGLANESERADEAAKLIAYGFNHFTSHKFFTKDQIIDQADVANGDKTTVNLTTAKDIEIVVPREEIKDINATIEYNGPLIAPISKGTEIAKITITIPNQGATTFPLVAAEDVTKLNTFGRATRRIRGFVGL
jgi:D-alanyl-D-alanine carboxypeptidase (penicillin-binding protein 5/6)